MASAKRTYIGMVRRALIRPPGLPLSTQPKHRKVDEAASYIINHYDESLSLEMISDHFYADKCYLSRIFKEVSGFTVNEYINMIRIRHARELLSSSSMSITEVSESVGYETITYFERVFNQYAQTSPSRYRKQYRLKNDF